jgi:predicted TIM-barrel fold metal-dependent hydrolase
MKMIIDVHTHIGCETLLDFPEECMPNGAGMFEHVTATKGRVWEGNCAEHQKVAPCLTEQDPTGEVSYKTLKEIGVDKAVLFPIDFTLIAMGRYRTGPGFYTRRAIEEINRHAADVAAKHPDKYIAFASVDPRHGQRGLDLLRRAVQEWGMKGWKMHPCAGYYPNDRELCYPFYEVCCELDIPILCHTGMDLYPLSGKYADPMFWDEIASDFPDMLICLAHGGGGFSHVPARHLWDTGLALASMHENIFLDTASGQAFYMRDPVEFYRELKKALDQVAGKIMWGTDNPYFLSTGGSWVQSLDLYRKPDPAILEKAGVSFTKEEIDGLIGENAKHFLKLA